MKGQYFSFDAIMATVIFLLALVGLLSYWYGVKTYLDYQSEDLSKEAVRVSGLLFGPPSPSTACTSLTRLGLAISWEDQRLDAQNLACAHSMDPNRLKVVLSTPFNVAVDVTRLPDPSPRRELSMGVAAPSTSKEIVKLRRLATIYNRTSGESYPAIVDISIYR
ncbi:hypothetical protein HY990_06470 [Candidatus Micrarchaeota archaeon]|nr:hypothetical protein [Candidatus Micrarchaeota archaeon]